MPIRRATASDVEPMWAMFREATAGGDTLPADGSATREAMAADWLGAASRAYVSVDGDVVVGMYRLVANQPDRGSHVANATYIVSSAHRGKGLGAGLVAHCLDEARSAGFAAIQFNFVVATNRSAVDLYRRFGFSVVGTLPGAFRHRELGMVDALVLFRKLE